MKTILRNTKEPFFAVIFLLITSTSFGQTWSETGLMSNQRSGHTATLLQDGKVLVTGRGTAACELYDPSAGTWSATGSLLTPLANNTATLLPNGKVLVTGGDGFSSNCELYDPVSGTWSSTTSMLAARDGHTATLLLTGKVLVAGGDPARTCELYDPVSETWTATTSTITYVRDHTATLLSDGNVLMAGGHSQTGGVSGNAELYNSTSATWTVSFMTEFRLGHTATLLSNGKVLVTGGSNNVQFKYLKSCELYDPASGSWSRTGDLDTPREFHTATLLPNNQVLVAGGSIFGGAFSELYNPTAGTWSTTDAVAILFHQTATLLPNGKVLLAGGTGDPSGRSGPFSSCWLYSPDPGPFSIIATAGPHGTITPAGTSFVPSGNSITYTITPDDGYQVVAESIDNPSSFDSSQTSPSYTFTNVQFAHTIAAEFVRSTYTLSYSAQANGSISGAATQTVSYRSDGSAVTAVPEPGYHFVSWSDGSTVNPRRDMNVINDTSVTASFAVSTYSLTTIATGHGKVSGKITFTADTGYHVTNVQIDGSSLGAVTSYTFSNLAADHTLNVNFSINTFSITASPGSNGTISPAGVTTANYGSSLTYMITPNPGYHITSVTADNVALGAVSSYTFTNITRTHTIKATFAINTYTIVSSAGANGTITPSGSATVNYGTTKKYTIKANSGYHIAAVLVDNISVGAVGTYTFTSISGNHTISVSFAANSFNRMAISAEQLKENTWALSAHPNPAKNYVRVVFAVEKQGDYFIKLTSLSGRILSVQKVNALAGTNMIELNVSNYAKGNYFITLTGDSKAKTISIIKAQ